VYHNHIADHQPKCDDLGHPLVEIEVLRIDVCATYVTLLPSIFNQSAAQYVIGQLKLFDHLNSIDFIPISTSEWELTHHDV